MKNKNNLFKLRHQKRSHNDYLLYTTNGNNYILNWLNFIKCRYINNDEFGITLFIIKKE